MARGMRRVGAVLGLGVMLLVGGCASVETAPAGKSLYDRLGGRAAISSVVDQFVANVANDTRINGRFATTDIPRLKGHLVDQVQVDREDGGRTRVLAHHMLIPDLLDDRLRHAASVPEPPSAPARRRHARIAP